MGNAQFRLDLRRIVEKKKVEIDVFAKRIAFSAFRKIVLRSPVDTGRFRANWVLSYSQIDYSLLEIVDKEGSPTLERIQAGLNSQELVGNKVFLSNSLPYAYVLEYGRLGGKPGSQQAPNGMVRITARELNTVLKS